MEDVKHWVYKPCWSYNINGSECYYSIYQVLMQNEKFKNDMRRIKRADAIYPLIVIEDDNDKYGSILDGNHRFAKMIMNKNKIVKIKYITKKELDKLKVTL